MLKFYSLSGCSPCHQMEDLLDELEIEYTKIDVAKLNYVIGGVPLLEREESGKTVRLRGYEEQVARAWLASPNPETIDP
jgi:hypothetical protein